MNKLCNLIVALLIVTLMVTTNVIALSVSPNVQNEENDDEINIISNIPLIILGSGNYYNIIINKMIEVSSDITLTSLDDLPMKVLSNEAVILVDATWVKTQDSSEVSNALKVLLDKGAPLLCIGEMSDIIKQTGYSMDYVGGCDLIVQGIKVFDGGQTAVYTGAGNIDDVDEMGEALSAAYSWALKWISNTIPDCRVSSSTGPLSNPCLLSGAYWGWVHDWEFNSLDSLKPYGRTNIQNEYVYLYNDNTDVYDWYSIHFCQEAVPGKVAYDRGYYTMHMHTFIDADYGPHASDELVKRGPTTTSGTTTATVNIGVTLNQQGAGVTCGYGWSYTISDVAVEETGDLSLETGNWKHEIENGCAASRCTLDVYPGASIRVNQGGSIQPYESYANAFGYHGLWGWYVKSEQTYIHIPFILA